MQDTNQCRFYLHPMIANWLRLRVGPDTRRQCTIESSYLVAKLIESTDLNSCSYAFRLYLLGHADECLDNKRAHLKPVDDDVKFVKILIDQLGKLFGETSGYREGISLVVETLPIIESAYGKDHPSTLDSVHQLGNLYLDQGKLAAAEEMYNRALVGYEKALGKDHALTLSIVNNLGVLYARQGKFAGVEEMYNRALAGYEKTLGKDHAWTLDIVNNLGVLYRDQGKLAAAEEMLNRALARYKKALGKDHARTLDTVSNLGILYRDQGKLAAAEEMHNRVLAGYEKAFGKDHARTLDTVNNLGVLYRDQGKLAVAEEMHNCALAGTEKAFGKDHPLTLSTVNNLGVSREVGSSRRNVQPGSCRIRKGLGERHTKTLQTVFIMAKLMEEQGDLKGASQMLKRAIFGYTNLLGGDNFETMDAQKQLERISHLQQKIVNSKKGFWKSLRQRLI